MSADKQARPWRAGPPRQEFTLLDRQTERAAIDQVLDAVRGGFSGTLVLRGGPGVGKTTLLRYAVVAAPDMRVTSIAGVESEISMEFGGLHQLLLPSCRCLTSFRCRNRARCGSPSGVKRGHRRNASSWRWRR